MLRLNWIDWVKAFCMTVVVFCHLPHQADTFHLQYLASVILSSFFFVSGYLKKPIASQKAALQKYIHSLLIPYLIYDALYYPYWLAKHVVEHGSISITEAFKPIIGTLLGQLNSNISCELNGVTWFLIALFAMHLAADLCLRHRHGRTIMLILTLLSITLYGANKYYHFAPYITFHGFVRCLCFFFMGCLFRQTGRLKTVSLHRDLAIGLPTLLLSLLLFYWHLHESRFVLHILLFYVVNLLSVYSIIHLCRCLDSLRLRLVTTISIGTMVIFGFHRILIGIFDYGFEHLTGQADIAYNWWQCLLLATSIDLLLLPLILLAQRRLPILLGRKQRIVCR